MPRTYLTYHTARSPHPLGKDRPVRPRRVPLLGSALAVTLAAALVGCSGLTDLGGAPDLPAGTQDPGSFRNPAGAMRMYWAVVDAFTGAVGRTHFVVGLLTDEFTFPNASPYVEVEPIDPRQLPEPASGSREEPQNFTTQVYPWLQDTRALAVQARGALAKYDPTAPVALRGHLYVLEGYADVYLADLFCSGVPLSELEFEGDYVYKPGLTTAQLYARAVALFDSALALSADSARIVNLARVGKARALSALSRDSLAAAAAVVAVVPTAFEVRARAVCGLEGPGSRVSACLSVATVSDHEGGNGLAYRSSGDPRTATTRFNNAATSFVDIQFPVKFGAPDTVSWVRVAGGVEARLIEAEAKLQAGQVSAWLAALNALRTDGTYTVSGPDTLWHAGTGGVAGLRPLTDPGTAAARVDLMFTERAFWLFGEAYRQGDLRRLIRQYGRHQQQVYPTGPYPQGAGMFYGTDVTLPVPVSERANPQFHGCFNREA